MDGNEGIAAPSGADAGAPDDPANETRQRAASDADDAPSEAPADATPSDAPSDGPSDTTPPDTTASDAPSDAPSDTTPPDTTASDATSDVPSDAPSDVPSDATSPPTEPQHQTPDELPPIFDLIPDRPAGGATGAEATAPPGAAAPVEGPDDAGDTTPVLGGAAAAEGRTTGPTPRIGGPAPAEPRSPQAGTNGVDEAPEAHPGEGDGRYAGPSRWAVALAALPVVALTLLLGAWAIDTAALSGQVQRNVEVADRPVGGLGEDALPEVMSTIGEEVARRTVTITSGDAVYETTAGEIGLALDAKATSEAALDAGRGDPLIVRPFAWLGSFFNPRDVQVRYTVSEPTAQAELFELQGADVTAPREPTIELTDEGWVAVPGVAGHGLDLARLVDALPAAAAGSSTGPIEIEVDKADVPPSFTDDEARELADRANRLTANGLDLVAGEDIRRVPPEQLRTWIGLSPEPGTFELTIRPDVVAEELPQVLADLLTEPQDARIVLTADGPSIIPSEPGLTCCGDEGSLHVWAALSEGEPAAEIDVTATDPAFTTADAEECGVARPVGGNNAWRDGAPATAGPGFTTYYEPGQPRVTNIHRIAEIVDGTLLRPGETFSMNDTVGERTADKGFVEAGAIRDGEHVDEIGGGVSQFATTTFNAAYFAGLDITTYQAHSEYFPRYPPGREATMGYPAPDLAFVNDTPHCILVDTSYTDDSVTVTLWSTPYATAEQTGISELMSGKCRVVTTTRTVTYPDSPAATDTFRATYRPGEGETC